MGSVEFHSTQRKSKCTTKTVPLRLCRALVPFAWSRKFRIDGKAVGSLRR